MKFSLVTLFVARFRVTLIDMTVSTSALASPEQGRATQKVCVDVGIVPDVLMLRKAGCIASGFECCTLIA